MTKLSAEISDQTIPLLAVQNLGVDYVTPGRPLAHALADVSFSLRQGEMLGVVGESGCGKTTLMLSLMRLLPPAGRICAGRVLLEGHDLLDLSEQEMAGVRWKELAMIFQGAMNALNPVKTVGSQIAEPIARHKMATLGGLVAPGRSHPPAPAPFLSSLNPTRTLGDQMAESIRQHEKIDNKAILQRRVAELLELVGISPNRSQQYPHQYSGGMRQRAMIAMALACFPKIIIADEPTTALDVMVQAQILELLDHLRQQLGLAVLLVTHDLGVVAEVCDRVLVMYGGVVAEYADVETIYSQPRHPYTQELLKAFPDLSRPGQRLTAIPGHPPRLDALPAGCRFAPRCPVAYAPCHQQQPPLIQIGADHQASCFLAQSHE